MNIRHLTFGTQAHFRRRLFQIQTGILVPPYALDVHPSDRCNLKCQWCIGLKTYRGKELPAVLDEKNVRTILENALTFRETAFPSYPEHVAFAGFSEEPLLSRATLPGMRFLLERGKKVTLTTNGTLLGRKEVQDAVVQIHTLEISLDASNAASYEAEKGVDHFGRVLRNISAVANRRTQAGSQLQIYINYVLTANNHAELRQLLNRLDALGVDEARFRLDLLSRDDPQLQTQLMQQFMEASQGSALPALLKSPDEPILPDSFEHCYSQQLWPAIGRDAKVYPCAHTVMPGFALGSLISHTMGEIWARHFGKGGGAHTACQKYCPSTCGNINLLASRLEKIIPPQALHRAISYDPIGMYSNYRIARWKRKTFLVNERPNGRLVFRIMPKGYIPKWGVILAENLGVIEGDKILELGTGQTAFIALAAAIDGAETVHAVEIAPTEANWARHNVALNELSDRVTVFQGDFFRPVAGRKYDRIVANPPYLPMSGEGTSHDSGGVDGWKYLDFIIANAMPYLEQNGELRLSIFDFLGVENRSNRNIPCALERLNQHGFTSFRVVARAQRRISAGSMTFKMLPHILRIYPDYRFSGTDGKLYASYEEIKAAIEAGKVVTHGLCVISGKREERA